MVASGSLVGATAISRPVLSWTPPTPLSPGTYYWHVLSYVVTNSVSPSSQPVWSPVESFTVPQSSNPPPPPPPVQQNSPAVHITRVTFGGGSNLNPTFFVSFSFDGCPGWCLVSGFPAFTLHRGTSPDGPRVALGTYLYNYQFSDLPRAPSASTDSSPCTVTGSTELKPSYVQCRSRRRVVRNYTVVISATVGELSADYPVSDYRSIRVACKRR
jgi:hypothetical protein